MKGGDHGRAPSLDPAVHDTDGACGEYRIVLRRDWLRTRLPGRLLRSPLYPVGMTAVHHAVARAVGHVVRDRGKLRSAAVAAVISSHPPLDVFFACVAADDHAAWDMIGRAARGWLGLLQFADKAYRSGQAYIDGLDAEAAETAPADGDEPDGGYMPDDDGIIDAEFVEYDDSPEGG